MKLLKKAILLSFAAFSLCASGLNLYACSGIGGACTEIGCGDEAILSFRTPADTPWSTGSYALVLTYDGVQHACQFTVPDALPMSGSSHAIPCAPDIGYAGVQFFQDSKCQTTRNGDSVSQSCTPIPGRYVLQATVLGTPKDIAVIIRRDDAEIINRNLTLQYSITQPNGPECGPTCHQASADVEVPQ
ncbi:MAG: hypothetical protein ACOY0T_32215 [Myxococcota bacterium]